MPSALDLLSGLVLGAPEEREQEGVLGAIGQIPQALGTAVRDVGFGALSEAGDVASGVLGRDVFGGGRHLEGWERGLALAGLAGGGVGAAMYLGGAHPFHVSGARRWRDYSWSSDVGAVGRLETKFRPEPAVTVTEIPEHELARLNTTLPDPDLVWGSVRQFTNRALGVRPDPNAGLDDLVDVAHKHGADSASKAYARGFLASYGDRLTREVRAHAGSAQNYVTPGHAAVDVAAYEMSRWQWGTEFGYLRGERLKSAGGLWERFRDGERLSAEDTVALQDAMVGYASALQFVVHPELALHPTVGVGYVDIDGGPRVGLSVLKWPNLPDEQLFETDIAGVPVELNRRLSKVFQTHPTAMVDWMRQNVVDFWTGFVEEDTVRRFRNWYPRAKTQIVARAHRLGWDPKRLTAAAAILSGKQGWEGNIEKAARVAELVEKAETSGTRSVDGILDAMADLQVSKNDLAKVILLRAIDDPDRIFRAGQAKGGRTLDELLGEWERGADPADLVGQKRQSTGALKQPSFHFGIWNSQLSHRKAKAGALRRMMAGEAGAAPGETPFENLRYDLPLVVDRQAFKIAVGFNGNPATWLSSNKYGYDSFAQSYRLAAAEIGEVDGIPLLPEELQAITWMEYRRVAGVTDENFQYQPGSPNRLLFREGVGPDFMFNDRIFRMLTEPPDTDWRALAGRTFTPSDVRTLNRAVTANQSDRVVVVESNPDGTTRVLAPPDHSPDELRGLSPTVAADQSGRVVWVPSRPIQVDNVDSELQRIKETTVRSDGAGQGGVGMQRYEYDAAAELPSFKPGFWLRVGAMTGEFDGAGAHRRLITELRRRGIPVEQADISQRGYMGQSTAFVSTHPKTGEEVLLWSPFDDAAPAGLTDREMRKLPTRIVDEARVNLYVKFGNADDLRAAWEFLDGDAGAGRRWVDDIYNEQVSERVAYVNGEGEAPRNTARVWEHHLSDGKRYGVHMNVEGEASRGNVVPVYISKDPNRFDFYNYLGDDRSARLGAGPSVHKFNTRGPVPMFDGQVTVMDTGERVRVLSRARSLFDVRVNGQEPSSFVLFVPEDGLAAIAYGVDNPAGLPQAPDPGRTVVGRRTEGKVTVGLPSDAEGRVDPGLATDVRSVLRRVGVEDEIVFEGRNR